MSTISTLVCLLAMLCLASGCDDSGPPPETDAPTAPPASTGCPNERDLVADEAARRGPLRGDVTGDGRNDEVFIAVDEGAETGCRALLILRFGTEVLAISIDGENVELGLGLPAPVGLKQVDGRGGSDVIIDLAAGAATLFAGVFSFADGSLEQIRIEGSQPPAVDLFAHGGSVGQLSGVDCGGDGGVVISTAVPEGRRYAVDRRAHEIDGVTLTRNPAEDQREKVRLKELPRRFPEFGGPPFSSCPDA